MTVKMISTAVADLGYREDGPADGTPVVLVHGFPDDPSTWDGVVAQLPAGVRAIRPYLRGYGPSVVTDPSAGGAQVAALAGDLLDLADGLGLERFLVVGHDWGSRAAHAAAVLAPERVTGLVTVSTAYGDVRSLGPDAIDEAAASWYRYWLSTAIGEQQFLADPLALTRWAFAHWGPAPTTPGAEEESFANPQFAGNVVHYYRHAIDVAPGAPHYVDRQAVLDGFPPVPVPTTFVIGLADGCEVPAASRGHAGRYPAGYERIELPGVGHFVQRERPEVIAEVVARRLSPGAG